MEKFPTTTSVWSSDIEQTIKEIGDSCKGYKWMNIFVAKKTDFIYNCLMYTSMTIGPLAGFLSAISVNDADHQAILSYISMGFSFTTGVLSAVIKFSSFGDKSITHKSIASKYASLEGNIRRQLSLPREDRVNAGEYLDWVSTSFDELFTSSPLIPDSIYEEWVKFAEENKITVPKELGRTVVDNTSEKLDQLCAVKVIDVNNFNASLAKNVTKNVEKEDKNVDKNVDKKGDKNVDKKGDEHEQKTDNTTYNTTYRERNSGYDSSADLNRYSDGKMRYELTRLFGMK